MPTNGTANGWTTYNNTGDAGWSYWQGFRIDGVGEWWIDPTIQQTVTNIHPGALYEVSGYYAVTTGGPSCCGNGQMPAFGVLQNGSLIYQAGKCDQSQCYAPGYYRYFTTTFTATSDKVTLALQAERYGDDSSFTVWGITMREHNVPAYTVDFASPNAVNLYIDAVGRQVAYNTGLPAVLRVNQIELKDFDRVSDKVVTLGSPGNDTLTISSTGPSDAQGATLSTTIVPVAQLCGGHVLQHGSYCLAAPITAGATTLTLRSTAGLPTSGPFTMTIQNERLIVSAISGSTLTVQRGVGLTLASGYLADTIVQLTTYYLNPDAQTYYGGEAVVDPVSGVQLFYSATDQVRDVYTGAVVTDPFGNPLLHASTDPMLHIAGDPVVHTRGETVTYLGGEPTFDEHGNRVYTGTLGFTHEADQGVIQNLGQTVFQLVDKNGNKQAVTANGYDAPSFQLAGQTQQLSLSNYTLANANGVFPADQVSVVVYDGSRIYALTEARDFDVDYANNRVNVHLATSLGHAVTVKVVVATAARHVEGETMTYLGNEQVTSARRSSTRAAASPTTPTARCGSTPRRPRRSARSTSTTRMRARWRSRSGRFRRSAPSRSRSRTSRRSSTASRARRTRSASRRSPACRASAPARGSRSTSRPCS